ncbi:MAG: glycoside hydrolase family 9 protein [Fibrobacter sp.]|nr:glycoside hydrolase family 9 protein [Fibrobacter sp.]
MSCNKKATHFMAATAIAALSGTAAVAATTPYDLIRPTWPLTWDDKVIDKFDTTITKKIGVLDIPRTPASFEAGALMPDTLDQAYLDAINTKISPIRVNQAGYLKKDTERQFYFVGSAEEFEVVDEMGKSLSPKVTGTFKNSEVETSSDWTIIAGTNAASNDMRRYKIDFTGTTGIIQIGNIPQSVPTEKRLRIKVGSEISSTFIVSDDVYTMVKDASLKFFGIQRSGNSQSWFHGPSHTKDGSGKVVLGDDAVADFTLKAGDLQGGWYDCGDHLKESQTQAFAFMTLAVMSATNPAKDVDHYAYNQGDFVKTDDVPDVLREAAHGAAFFVNSYRAAKGIVDNMVVSVGNFGSDHGWWGRPEAQDALTVTGRGGSAERDLRLGEIGSNVGGEIAAGLAIVGKLYAKYDKDFADSCLTVAEKMYDFAKSLALGKDTYDNGKKFVYNKEAAGWGSPAYMGSSYYHDKLAIAAIALHYATYEKTKEMNYLNDAVEDKTIGVQQESTTGFFNGGWMAHTRDGMRKIHTTDWSNSTTFALYGFYKLLLKDKDTASKYGISEDNRQSYAEKVAYNLANNLTFLSSSGTSSIAVPSMTGFASNLSYGSTWYDMSSISPWLYNRYYVGNTIDVLAYADVTKDLEEINLPEGGKQNWNSSKFMQLGINQLNYLLGVNPWDISFVYGVGDKNDNHPFHRASNPEGKNTPAWNYKYVRPVGALFGGTPPNSKNSMVPSSMSWEDYHISDVCLDASAVLTSSLTILSNGGNDYYEKKCDNCKTTDASPFSMDMIQAELYHYAWGDMDVYNVGFINHTLEQLDSVVVYIYFEAPEEEVSSCNIMFDLNICQAYDQAGFNKPCPNDKAITNAIRGNKSLQKVEDSYDSATKNYTWALPIVLDSVVAGGRVRMDISTSSGVNMGEGCETSREPAKYDVSKSWSFGIHKADKNMPAYAGAPTWDKDQGDYQEAPAAPYIVIRSKGKLLWGYGPVNETADRVIETPIDSTEAIKVAVPAASAKMFVTGQSLFVQTNAQGVKSLKIFDLLGNQLMSRSFEGTYGEVRFEELPKRGTLIAKLVSGNKVLASKAFKVK